MGNKQTKEKYINKINSNKEINVYKIFNISKEFTWDELKISYKKLAIVSHPDKGGDKIIFDFVTKKFKELANEYKLRENNSNYDELKRDFNDYNSKNINNSINKDFDDNLTFNERLNKHFQEVKLYDEDIDFGYGNDMIESSDKRGEIKIDNIFKKKNISNEIFNQKFNNSVTNSKELIKHNGEPKPMILAKSLAYSEIGSGRNDDYSSSIEKTNNLAYTDYMKAHRMNRLVENSEFNNIKQYKNTEEYKKYSDNKIKKGLTKKELKELDNIKLLEEKNELERLNRIKKQNIEIEKKYNIANQLFIKK